MSPTSEVQRPNRRLNRRLDSWKEIAAFFDRDERTVKRWEKERALPVHRLPGGSRARVFAFTEELSRWMHSQDVGAGEVLPAEASELKGESVVEPPAPPLSPELPDETVVPARTPTNAKKSWVIAGGVMLILVTLGIAMAGRRQRTSAGTENKSASSDANLAPLPPAKPDAATEELYLKGRYYWHKRTPADLNKAVDYFTQAIVHNPSYAPAYVGLADCYNLLREFADMPPEEAFLALWLRLKRLLNWTTRRQRRTPRWPSSWPTGNGISRAPTGNFAALSSSIPATPPPTTGTRISWC